MEDTEKTKTFIRQDLQDQQDSLKLGFPILAIL